MIPLFKKQIEEEKINNNKCFNEKGRDRGEANGARPLVAREVRRFGEVPSVLHDEQL